MYGLYTAVLRAVLPCSHEKITIFRGTQNMNEALHKPFFLWKHLNKLRWLSLTIVFATLILIPFLHVYQTYVSAHTYDLLSASEKQIYDTMEWLSSPFVDDPEDQLDALKGNTWSGTFGGVQLSDPLAVLGQLVSSQAFYWPFILTGLHIGNRRFDRRLKYVVLAIGLAVAVITGSVAFAAIYPPAVIGREIYYAIALGGFGSGVVFFLLTLLFDLLLTRRGFCRYICPGGALYSLLGRFRLLRIKRIVENCNDCAKCTAVCEFGLDPLHDQFGQECNNCTACVAVCPTDAMTFYFSPQDIANQGPGHLGRKYKQHNSVFDQDNKMAGGE